MPCAPVDYSACNEDVGTPAALDSIAAAVRHTSNAIGLVSVAGRFATGAARHVAGAMAQVLWKEQARGGVAGGVGLSGAPVALGGLPA